jgi:hypothetical protein
MAERIAWQEREYQRARDELLRAALLQWRLRDLEEIQAEYNSRGAAKDWRLNEIVSVLIGLEHDKLFPKAKQK